jgi:hypothetical protein
VTISQARFVAFVDSLAVHLDDHAARGAQLAARLHLSRFHPFAAHNRTLVVLALKQASSRWPIAAGSPAAHSATPSRRRSAGRCAGVAGSARARRR